MCYFFDSHYNFTLYLEIKLKVDSTFSDDGEVFIWGRCTHGQLGHRNLDSIPYPKFVKFLENHKVTKCPHGRTELNEPRQNDNSYIFCKTDPNI